MANYLPKEYIIYRYIYKTSLDSYSSAQPQSFLSNKTVYLNLGCRSLLTHSLWRALPSVSCLIQRARTRLSARTERRVNKGPGSAAQTPLLQESAPVLQVRVKLITTILLKQCSHWHDNFSQNAILISTQHTKITGEGGKKKKQFTKILCLCNSLNAIFYCCLFQQSH